MKRTLWLAALGSALVALLAILGTLQYRWLGDVSTAERDRLRASMRTRAADLSREFDREITRVYLAFHLEGEAFDKDPAGRLGAAYSRAQQLSPGGGLVKGVFFVDARGGAAVVQRLDAERGTLTTTDWPPEFDAWRRRADNLAPSAPGFLPPLFMADAVDAATPALIVPVATMTRLEQGGRIAVIPDPRGVARTVVVWLDADRIRTLLSSLVARQFGADEGSEFYVTVAGRDPAVGVVFSSAPGVNVTSRDADVATGLFDLRLDELNYFTAHVPPPSGSDASATARPAGASPSGVHASPSDGGEDKGRVAITIVRRATGPNGPRVLMSGGDGQGAWQVLIRYKSGSLDALVARSRSRNLAIGLGVLSLLAAGFVFVVGSALRQQHLARQQMEFVAAVSHELRTPLAVIRSAAENLADGVVGDGAQVRRYGSLIRSEGVRLSDMVERVMEYAGIQAGAPRARIEVDLARVVREALAAAAPGARDREVRIEASVPQTLPCVLGDEDALRSAVQNVVGNAVKYSPDGATVRVVADAGGGRVRVSVVDSGPGIDADDLPHIFKPFYRGRRARDRQVRGTGVGLSVVRHVVDTHQGEVDVASRVGEGTTVTLAFRAMPPAESGVAEARAAT